MIYNNEGIVYSKLDGKNNCPTDCAGLTCPGNLTKVTGIGSNFQSVAQLVEANRDYCIGEGYGDLGQTGQTCVSDLGSDYDIACSCISVGCEQSGF